MKERLNGEGMPVDQIQRIPYPDIKEIRAWAMEHDEKIQALFKENQAFQEKDLVRIQKLQEDIEQWRGKKSEIKQQINQLRIEIMRIDGKIQKIKSKQKPRSKPGLSMRIESRINVIIRKRFHEWKEDVRKQYRKAMKTVLDFSPANYEGGVQRSPLSELFRRSSIPESTKGNNDETEEG